MASLKKKKKRKCDKPSGDEEKLPFRGQNLEQDQAHNGGLPAKDQLGEEKKRKEDRERRGINQLLIAMIRFMSFKELHEIRLLHLVTKVT